ncbi:PaaI family thioesterase [Flavobacterium sp. KACC 22758]|uniref:PaaI family thioesterase n=1 Tax=Flavobacterium sp. KACC 22758 TaxID=3025667 RepID=UPI002366A40F|nr:PaaI family thioesterase [Flavobacterium sp. KACC 22758]WDF61511.1 PaaI family thioesterase [Flavobacterium sp. KACC 22758]
METKTRLQVLQDHINREFTASPSPFMLWMRPIVLAAEEGTVTFKYMIREEMSNPIQSLHGGVTAAIADDCIGATMFSLNEETFYTTINLVVDYFAPAHVGDTILAKTLIIKKGRQMVNAQCEIWNADQTRLIARATSNLFKTNVVKKVLS